MTTKRRLLWIGDAACASGFARATHQILEAIYPVFDVHVLGVNYHGDPHNYPYPIYPAYCGGDLLGYGRIQELIEKIGPALVIIQTDPWYVQRYLEKIGNIPTIGVIAVDSKNCQGIQLNGLSSAIFWTPFALEEARIGGFTGPAVVIPLGVDTALYHPLDRVETRERMSLPMILQQRGLPLDTFIVGVVAKNQQRKRLDLTLQYFSEWVHGKDVTDAALWLHVAPTTEAAYDLSNLAEYYRIADRVLVPSIHPVHGIAEPQMVRVYALFDLFFSTTLGEGWGLPVLEAMACGVPCLVPSWAALGEQGWCGRTAITIPCTATMAQPEINTIGGVADRVTTIDYLDHLYRNRPASLQMYQQRSRALAEQPQFRWASIGQRYVEQIQHVLNQQTVPTPDAEMIGTS